MRSLGAVPPSRPKVEARITSGAPNTAADAPFRNSRRVARHCVVMHCVFIDWPPNLRFLWTSAQALSYFRLDDLALVFGIGLFPDRFPLRPGFFLTHFTGCDRRPQSLANGVVVLGGCNAKGKHEHRAQQDTCL